MGGGHDAPLNVAIVGAGIGGLTAALELREHGHNITVFEQSRFANEYGAAIHLAPNANGLLTRLGINLAEDGGIPMVTICEGARDATIKKTIPIGKGMAMWQSGTLFCHRRTLHERLKREATGNSRKGKPVVLKTSSKVKTVVAKEGTVELENGETFTADVVLGADGVHSTVRKVLFPGAQGVASSSGKNAYRFLLKKTDIERQAPDAYELVKADGMMIQWYDLDRRMVSFPADHNEWLNFVCMHPEELSDGSSDEWSRVGDRDRMLEIYKDFDPKLKALLGCAPADSLKVWKLLDLAPLPHWVDGKVALLGDAAHPFLPYNGQGGCCAIEDAASVGVMLPLGTTPDEVPDRLKLYEKARMAHAHELQEYSRSAGRDLRPDAMDMVGKVMQQLAAFAYARDEFHHSTQVLREHLQKSVAGGLIWRSPVGFGPAPGPRQTFAGGPQQDSATSPYRAVSVRFKTSRTLLQNLLPRRDALAFDSPGTVAEATWKYQRNASVAWLGGRPYSHLSLYLHGIRCTKPDGTKIVGDFLLLMLEDRAEPVVTGRDELGFPKLACDLRAVQTRVEEHDAESVSDGVAATGFEAAWDGHTFLRVDVPDAKPADPAAPAEKKAKPAWGPPPSPHAGTLVHRYVPAVGKRGEADADYIACVPPPGGDEKPSVERKWAGSEASVSVDAGDWQKLPTLHHIADRLQEIPVFGVVETVIAEGKGVGDHRHIYRVF